MKERHVSEVNGDDVLAMIAREQLGDRAAPVTAVRDVATIAQLRHQFMPAVTNTQNASVRVWSVGEHVPGQTRRDDVERVARIGTVARWIGEHRDDLREACD